jgi:FkbM family methyltransferase
VVVLSRERGRHRPQVHELAPGTTVVGPSRPRLRSHRLGDDGWVVSRHEGRGGPRWTVDRLGAEGWLVSSAASPAARLRLETRAGQLLAHRHVAWVLETYGVDCVLDVGANKGQYGRALRHSGYTGHIVSFEPVPEFFEELSRAAADDDRWTVHQLALGTEDATLPIHVQRTLSSALPSTEYGRGRFSGLREGAERNVVVEVPLRRLDGIVDDVTAHVPVPAGRAPRLFLKMDTQGFDLQAFGGLGARVEQVVAMQSEVALLLIYEGMPRMAEALPVYEAAGFEISGLFPVTREKDGRVIEYDCVMVRPSALPR